MDNLDKVHKLGPVDALVLVSFKDHTAGDQPECAAKIFPGALLPMEFSFFFCDFRPMRRSPGQLLPDITTVTL